MADSDCRDEVEFAPLPEGQEQFFCVSFVVYLDAPVLYKFGWLFSFDAAHRIAERSPSVLRCLAMIQKGSRQSWHSRWTAVRMPLHGTVFLVTAWKDFPLYR